MSETFRPAFEGRAQPSVSYGIPFTDAVAEHASSTFNDASGIYILASASLARDTAHLSDLRAKLGPKVAGVRVGMRPHTYWSEILAIVSEARELKVDLLVTLGAGSLTDASKIVSFALANDVSSPDELESLCPSSPKRRPEGDIRGARIPIVCVPTSLAGGEYSAFAGATNDADGRKYSFSGPGMLCPALVILDPALALSTPPKIWLSTGVKAVDHCVETLCSLQSDDGADADARRGLGKLVPALLRCAADKAGKDEGARLESQLGVVDAMSACSRGVPLGASHGIGHQLGPAGVGHGETSCILMPAVCTFNYRRDANRARQDAIRELLWDIEQARELFLGKGLARAETGLGDLLDVFVRSLGMPRTLSEFGIGEDKLDGIAQHSLQDRWVKTNPAALDKGGVLEILRMVLG